MGPPRLRRSVRFALLLGLASLSCLVPRAGRAGGAVVVPAGSPAPAKLDARVAVAITPYGTVRWSQVTVASASSRVMWLVPARPGAAIDWADAAWFPSLEDATGVRVVPPLTPAPCLVPKDPETAAPWSQTGIRRAPSAIAVHTTEADARAHVAARGFGVSADLGSRIESLYRTGWKLVSLETDGVGAPSTSPTLRIADDGPAVLPFALTGGSTEDVRLTAFVIGSGAAQVPTGRDFPADTFVWGPMGAHYTGWREADLGNWGSHWLRESASSKVLFEGEAAPGVSVPSFSAGYMPACVNEVSASGSFPGKVGRMCPPGNLARVPGGSTCAASEGELPPSFFTCGSGKDDLALALGGNAPSSVVVTRFVGIVPKYGLGSDVRITTTAEAERSPILRTTEYTCTDKAPASPAPSGGSSTGGTRTFRRTDSCSGGTTVIVVDESEPPPDEGCGGDTTTSSSSTSSSSSGEGWDVEDDDTPTPTTGDGWDTDDSSSSSSADCGGDSSSTSSSDSCDSDSSSSSDSCDSGGSSSDGWDDADMAPKKKTSGLRKKHRSSSPVSRYALFFAALLLPLRRRTRLPRV